jgi:Ca2+-binding EF-hand superfamily protein
LSHLSQADIDRNGTIHCSEFVAATLHANILEREENLVSAFSFFDMDANGYITTDELSQACRELGVDDGSARKEEQHTGCWCFWLAAVTAVLRNVSQDNVSDIHLEDMIKDVDPDNVSQFFY